MSAVLKQIGLENRTAILPTPSIPKVPGVFGPDYSFADNVRLPNEVGVYDGDSITSVIDSVKGAAYYIDTIGFGQSSSPLTAGMGIKPIGVNTYMRTGFTCANGAEMWMYNEGIPTGRALGKRVADGLQKANLPQLRGLAPGIMEDAQSALDPEPLMRAMFGTGYPNCKYEMNQVGDQDGNIQNSATQAYYVENPETVVRNNGVPMQGRWVYDSDLTSDQYTSVPKTHCPDGFPKKNHKDTDCLKPLQSMKMDSFRDYATSSSHRLAQLGKAVGIAACILFGIGIFHRLTRKK